MSVVDDMKREGRPFRNLTIFSFMIFAFTFLYVYLNNKYLFFKGTTPIWVIRFLSLWFGCFGLYGWIYAIKYKVEFDKEKIVLKTMFKKQVVKVGDIEKYTCKRYRKSVFFQYCLFVKSKKVLVNTRYKEEFDNILCKVPVDSSYYQK